MLNHASIRDRIFVLLVGGLVLGASASGVSLWALDGVARHGREAARIEFELGQTLGRVAAGHLKQTAALESALWEVRPISGRSPGEERFEERAAAIWLRLQETRSLLEAEPSGRSGPELGDLLAELDRAHNAYADRARLVLAALSSGRRAEARALNTTTEAASQEFQEILGAVFSQVSERAEAEFARLHDERRRVIQLVSVLAAAAVLAGIAVLFRALQLVSRIRSMSGLVPICASCKSIRDDQGYWNQLESFVEKHSDAQFSHGLCGPCVEKIKAETKAA